MVKPILLAVLTVVGLFVLLVIAANLLINVGG